eukprot:6877243-Pyramimonas_sp.AAC.1
MESEQCEPTLAVRAYTGSMYMELWIIASMSKSCTARSKAASPATRQIKPSPQRVGSAREGYRRCQPVDGTANKGERENRAP